MFDGIRLVFTSKLFVDNLINRNDIEHDKILCKESAIKSYIVKYKGLNISMLPFGYTVIKGSLHKYFNDGSHNYNDFTIEDLKKVLCSLTMDLGVDTNSAVVNNLEFGVNIEVGFNPDNFLNQLIRFKDKQFSIMRTYGEGNGKECYYTQYGIKIYNKGLQYQLSRDILRIEKKIIKMNALRFKKPLILTDLLDLKLWNHCKEQLLNTFKDLIINDEITTNLLTNKEQQIYSSVVNQSNWIKYDKTKKCRYKKVFKQIISNYGTEKYIQNIIPLVSSKCDELLNQNATFLPYK